MNRLSELSYIHLVNQLKAENQMLRGEVDALRKLLTKQRLNRGKK